jgi:hypothetical protein
MGLWMEHKPAIRKHKRKEHVIVDSAAGHASASAGATPVIQGFEKTEADRESEKMWQPVSDHKIRVGIIGYGVCGFGAAFHFQDHPNVTVTAVADMAEDKCAALAKACRCEKMYASGEELVYYSKPRAEFVTCDGPLNDAAITTYFKGVCEAASGCLFEIAQREVGTIFGDFERGRRYVRLAKEAVDRYWRP